MLIRKMRKGTVVRPDEIPIEVCRCLGEEGMDWLAMLFNVILKNTRMPDE